MSDGKLSKAPPEAGNAATYSHCWGEEYRPARRQRAASDRHLDDARRPPFASRAPAPGAALTDRVDAGGDDAEPPSPRAPSEDDASRQEIDDAKGQHDP